MKLTLLLVALTIAASPAQAAKKKTKALEPEPERNISVPVPATELYLSTKPNEDVGPAIASFEFGVSFWAPGEFTRPTYGRGTSTFVASGLPFLYLNRLAPLYLLGEGANGYGFHSRLGLSFARLERSGQFTSGSSFVTTQTMNLISLRAGVEFLGPRFLGQLIQPYANLSLLPTLGLSSQSQLEGSVSRIGLPLETGLGLILHPEFLREFLGMRNGALGAGAHYIFGTLDNSKMNDLSAQIFLRLDI
jgi:hypothetical protein